MELISDIFVNMIQYKQFVVHLAKILTVPDIQSALKELFPITYARQLSDFANAWNMVEYQLGSSR